MNTTKPGLPVVDPFPTSATANQTLAQRAEASGGQSLSVCFTLLALAMLAVLALTSCSSPPEPRAALLADPTLSSVTLIEAPTQCSGGAVPVWTQPLPTPVTGNWITLPWTGAPSNAAVALLCSIQALPFPIDLTTILPGCWLLVAPQFIIVPNAPVVVDATPHIWHHAWDGYGEVFWRTDADMAIFPVHLQLVVVDGAGVRGSNALLVKIGASQ